VSAEITKPTKASEPKPGRWKRIAKRLVIAIPLLLVLGLVGGNLFLATPMGRGFVAKKMSRAMQMPVEIGSASYTPWGGLRVRDLRVDQVSDAKGIVGVPFFEAASFEAHVSLFSLLTKEVKVTRLVCESPKISIVKRKKIEATAVSPSSGAKIVSENLSPADPEVSPPPKGDKPIAGRPSGTKRTPPPATAPKKKGRAFSIGEVVVHGGSFTLSNYEGEELLRVEGLEMSLDLSEGARTGTLGFEKAVLVGGVEVNDVESPLAMLQDEAGWLELQDLSGDCLDGEISGNVKFAPKRSGKPFIAQLSGEGIDVAELAQGRAGGLLSGVVSGRLALRGFATRPDLASGGGAFSIDSVVLAQGKGFEKVRDALEVDTGGEVHFDPAGAQFIIDKGNLIVRDASFGSGKVLVRSLGGVSRKGGLNVATRLYIDASLYSGVRANPVEGRGDLAFEQLEGTDWFYRDELVTGTVKDPRIDFWRTGDPQPLEEVVKELGAGFQPQQIDPGEIGGRE